MSNKNAILLSSLFSRYADHIALSVIHEKISWSDLLRRVQNRQQTLHKTGLAGGDKCAIYAHASLDYIETLLAMWFGSIIAVPLNIRFPGSQIAKMLGMIKCNNVMCDPQNNLQGSFNSLKFPQSKNNISNGSVSALKANMDNPATIIFTSGSSGSGKACLHTYGNHYFSALGSNENIQLNPGDRWLLSLPLYHVAGIAILFRCLVSGATICIPHPESSLEESLELFKPTHLSLVAAQLHQLMQNERATQHLKSAKAILLGGSAIPETLIEHACANQLPIFTSYGSTEMSSQITTTRPGDSLKHLKTSGVVLKHREIKIGADGEILVRGKTLFQGYVHGDDLLSAVDDNGWFHTSDLGELDSAGYLRVLGRKDNMFISGGENIYPEEIERAIEQLNGVIRAVIVPIDNAKFGKRPVAFVHMRAGNPVQDIDRDELRAVLPGYKIPDYFFEC